MKILFLSNWYPTDDAPHLGLFVKEHVHALHMQNNEVHVLALLLQKGENIYKKETTHFIDVNGISTHIITLKSRFKDLLYYASPLHSWVVKRYIKKSHITSQLQFDIVHSNVVYPIGIVGSSVAKQLKLPHTITEHWSRLNRMMKLPVYAYLCKKTYREAAAILPVSNFLKNNINSYLNKDYSTKFHVVGNIINHALFYNNPEKRNQKQDFIQFTAVATWNNKKQPDKLPELFIQALAEAQKHCHKELRLTMIGGGDRLDELKKLCKNLKLNTEFTGYIDKTEIATRLQASDFFLHASTVETFSIVVAEALSSGTPVVCSNVAALPELVNKSNGVLCENTLEAWITAIQQATDSKFNQQEISNRVSKRFSYETIGHSLSNVLRDAKEKFNK